MEKLYKAYKRKAHWFLVYIREAHPSDGWQVDANVKAGIEIEEPKTMEERMEVARTCYSTLGLSFPAVVDGMDNKVEEAYAGWPDRLYVIDKEGNIAYKGERGPRGFKPLEMAQKLKALCPT